MLVLLVGVLLGACGYGDGDAEQQAASEVPEAEVQAEPVASAVRQAYPNLPAEVVYENDRMVVQKPVAEPGVWTGEHAHPGNQLVIAVTGGTMMYREGGEETERTFTPGEVFVVEPTEAHDHTTAGDAAAEFVLISMAPGDAGGGGAQAFPNVDAEVVFENDMAVAQKLAWGPGGWAGEHAHAGGQVVVMLTGGTMTYREGGEETERVFTPGEVFVVDPTEAHDHAVTGDTVVEAILITMK
jgi:quercetin dioxygenase-like cupin family protein